LTSHEAASFKESKFLRRDEQMAVVDESVRKKVQFVPANLVSGRLPSPTLGTGGWDIVVCANVLYYFARPTVGAVLERVTGSMGENAALFLGGEELLPQGLGQDLRVVRVRDAFTYVRGDWKGRLPEAISVDTTPTKDGLETARALERLRALYDSVPSSPFAARPSLEQRMAAVEEPPSAFAAVKDKWELDDIKKAADRGDMAGAIQAADRLAEGRPEMPEAKAIRAYLRFRTRRFDEALDAFSEAVLFDPLAPELHFFLGYIFNTLARYDEAIAAFSSALFIEPDFMFARYQLALAMHALERFADAAKEYERARNARDRGGLLERLRAQAVFSGESFWVGEAGMERLIDDHRAAALNRQPVPSLAHKQTDKVARGRDIDVKPRGRAS